MLIYTLTCQVFMSLISAVNMSLAFNESSAIQCFEHANAQQNNVQFLPGTATYAMYVYSSKVSIAGCSVYEAAFATVLCSLGR